MWLSEMHDDPNVAHLVVASADNQVPMTQDACKSRQLHVFDPTVDKNCSGKQ